MIRETLQAQSTIQEKTQQSDLEYKLFMQYHSKLSDVPSLVDLTSHFVAANIITSSDAETVKNTITTESQTTALRKLLNKISLALLRGHDNNKLFDKMLEIMQMYGDDIVQQLAADMSETIVKQRSAASATSGTYSIKNVYMRNYRTAQIFDGVKILTNLTNFQQFVNIFPIKIFHTYR